MALRPRNAVSAVRSREMQRLPAAGTRGEAASPEPAWPQHLAGYSVSVSEVKIGALCLNQYSDWPSLLQAGIRADELGYDSLWT